MLLVASANNASSAELKHLDTQNKGKGWTVEIYETDKGQIVEFWKKNGMTKFVNILDDPNPEGDGTGGGGLNADTIKAAIEMAKKAGSAYAIQPDGWKNLFGHTNAPNDMGPNVIDPPKGAVFEEDGGGGGSGGSFDPNVPLGEQLPNQPGSSQDHDDEDGDDGRPPDPVDAYIFSPDIIDPSPEPEADLFSASMADALAADGASEPSQAGFVLMSPSVQGIGPGGSNQSLNRMDPQPIPWATFGGHPGTFQRPTAVAGQGLR